MGSKEEITPSYFQQEVVTTQDNLDIANSTNESINLPPILMHLYNGDARSDSCIPNINFLTLDIASTLQKVIDLLHRLSVPEATVMMHDDFEISSVGPRRATCLSSSLRTYTRFRKCLCLKSYIYQADAAVEKDSYLSSLI